MNERKIFLGALLGSVLLHLILLGSTWNLDFFPLSDTALASGNPEEFEVFLLPEEPLPDNSADTNLPKAYTSIPERLAEENPPEDPDFLSMYNALAADQVEGGDGGVPAAEEEFVVPKVEIQKEDLDGAGGDQYAQVPLPETEAGRDQRSGGQAGEDEEKTAEEEQGPLGGWPLPRSEIQKGAEGEGDDTSEEKVDQPDLSDMWGGEAPTILKEGDEGAAGDKGFDFNQAPKGSVGSGVAIDGDFSLNTYEWDYAPWMKRFENELHRHWVAPYAYRLGVISGMTLIKLVVEKDGRPSVLEIIETDGHESLHTASMAALKAFSPYAPLPAHFPEENLVITLGLHYPAWH